VKKREYVAWRLWKVVDQFTADHRRMLTIECPDCQHTYTIRKTQYRVFRTCIRCRFVAQNRNNLGQHRGVGDLTKTYYNYFRFGAKRRNIPFTVSIEYLWNLAVEQNMQCALSGLEIVFPTIQDGNGNWTSDMNVQQRIRHGDGRVDMASLDRINSALGYVEGNVQWVNKWVNVIKNGLSHDEFVHLCHLVTSRHADPEPSRLNWFPIGQGRVGRKVQRLEGAVISANKPSTSARRRNGKADGDDIVRHSVGNSESAGLNSLRATDG
jgi:hypothetical protein